MTRVQGWRMTYRYASTPIRRQAVYTVLFILILASSAVVFADSPQHPLAEVVSLVTLPNVLGVVSLVYGAGMLREQFADIRGRVAALEKEFEQAMTQTLPTTYVRQDVYRAERHSQGHP